MMNELNALELVVLRDPAASYWLKDAVRTSLERDPVDFLHDAETLLEAARLRIACAGLDPTTPARQQFSERFAADAEKQRAERETPQEEIQDAIARVRSPNLTLAEARELPLRVVVCDKCGDESDSEAGLVCGRNLSGMTEELLDLDHICDGIYRPERKSSAPTIEWRADDSKWYYTCNAGEFKELPGGWSYYEDGNAIDEAAKICGVDGEKVLVLLNGEPSTPD